MYSLLTLAYLFLTPLPQEKQGTPPQGNSTETTIREMISNAKSVKGELSIPAGPSLSEKNLGGKSGRTSNASNRNVTAHLTKNNDASEKFSTVFIENALYQQELANRQRISVEPINTPEAALAELKSGNARFVKGGRVRTLMTVQDIELRATLAKKQEPFAVVVTCSDSRAMDNLIFDQELGRVFSIRAAGNSPDTLGIASIEYAVEHLGSKIVVIMGHTKCGAVGAVADAKGEPLNDHLYIFQHLMAGLLESTPKAKDETDAEYKDRLEQVNAKRQAQAVYNRSNIIRELVDRKKIWLVPASYDLNTGEVTFYNLTVGTPRAESAHH